MPLSGLSALPAWDEDGHLRVVVECPGGSRVKLKYDASLGSMTLGRTLPAGLAFPHDFGFVPGTSAPDGDPVDVMLVLGAPTYPGVIVAARPIGVLRASQRSARKRRRIRNDRILAVAADDAKSAGVVDVSGLAPRVREELALFFRMAVALEGKELRALGWGSAREARTAITAAARAAALG